METRTFDLLTPDIVAEALESVFGLKLDGTLTAYPSYVNRVYGVRDEDGAPYIVKFYRPGRWTHEAVLEEHRFVIECASAEIPVVAPIPDPNGVTLHTVTVEDEGPAGQITSEDFRFALFPKKNGRNFDAESTEDWMRLGSLTGRMHMVARSRPAVGRLSCTPGACTAGFLDELHASGTVHTECAAEFFDLAATLIQNIAPRFEGLTLHRLHGDCHRGNILDRPGEGLLLIDFDDMMNGPAIQDLWLLLPGRREDCSRELNLLLEGYETFVPFEYQTLDLVEPLRFMRMIYYLAWCARQRDDKRFRHTFPDWGSKAFWIKELEDLREQSAYIDR